jgi:isopentenyl-diphosphate Delta-isomerase
VTGAEELVFLVDEDGTAIGTAPKASVHHTTTPLHLAFSCYVFDAAGRLLVTQRALHKPTFPGVWSNSVCGHPAPGEPVELAVAQRVGQELGISLTGLTLVLPTFRYQATMPNGVRENELCPVFAAHTEDEAQPDPSEVEAWEWVDWARFRDEVLAGSRDVSSWCAEQLLALTARELPEGGFAPGSPRDLPAAARPDAG